MRGQQELRWHLTLPVARIVMNHLQAHSRHELVRALTPTLIEAHHALKLQPLTAALLMLHHFGEDRSDWDRHAGSGICKMYEM